MGIFYDGPIYFWKKIIRRPNLRVLGASIQAVMRATGDDTKLIITQDPRISLYCALFCRLLQIRVIIMSTPWISPKFLLDFGIA